MGFFSGLDADKYDRQYSDSYLFKRLGDYLRPHLRRVTVIIVTGLLSALVLAFIPIITASGLDVLERQGAASRLILLLAALLLTAVLRYVFNLVMRLALARVVGDVTAQMRKDAFAATINRDMVFFDENKSGKVLSRITSDTEEFAQVFTTSFDLVVQLTQFSILLFALLRQSVQLTLVLFGFIPAILALALYFRKLARNVTRQGSRAMAAVNDTIQESVSGISIAKNFRREAMMYQEFTSVNVLSYRINLRRGFVLSLVFPVFNALSGVAIAILMYVGATIVVGGGISVGAWYLFLEAADRFWFPIINIASYWSQFQQAMSDLERIFALIDAENEVRQIDDRPASGIRGAIEFKDTTFEYKPGQPVLQHFDLSIRPGESVAFVGHTGAGKSTIIKLITRFYEFQGGEILIDGQDIRSFNLREYRSRLGLVPQTPFLFSGTILDNSRYARPEAADSEIEEIAYSIGGGEWLETLPNGLLTDVGERGARLSMGQRQLVALLRVLVQKPAIFILDEATASIDPFTEMQIQQALNMILARTTSIMIAHRLSTVRSADRIIVLREGQIIEQGDHEQLMARGGHYAELYDTYFRHQSLSYVENARSLLADDVAR
ncbi:MAG: ABC transporter ATP-binding protein [Anaerolineae bacterium]